jgi:tRNA 2-thiocytidine biosynthesis protein TtcA
VLPEYLEARGVPFRVVEQDTYSVVKRVIPEGKTMCSLCSRLRRGILYRVAGELGATKIALGHHRDDVLATFFLNLFHGGQLKAMPAKLASDDGKRKVIGQMLRDWERQHPGRTESILRAMTEVRPSHLLDRKLFDFASLKKV